MAYSPSEKYPGAVDVDPDYQGGKFRDNNPSTTNNGSPLKAIDRNELLARDEAIMNDAGFEYSGVADTPQDSQLFKAYKASLGNGANLLSNHNFLTQRAGHTQPPPSSTPTSYPPGYELFQGVFANETTGITNLTYIDDRVSFSGGDLYFPVPNTGGIERLTEFAASVADFDGKPRQLPNSSLSLVGDNYRVTVGVADLAGGPLGSVKFEQGSVSTGHEVLKSLDGELVTVLDNPDTARSISDRFSDSFSFKDMKSKLDPSQLDQTVLLSETLLDEAVVGKLQGFEYDEYSNRCFLVSYLDAAGSFPENEEITIAEYLTDDDGAITSLVAREFNIGTGHGEAILIDTSEVGKTYIWISHAGAVGGVGAAIRRYEWNAGIVGTTLDYPFVNTLFAWADFQNKTVLMSVDGNNHYIPFEKFKVGDFTPDYIEARQPINADQVISSGNQVNKKRYGVQYGLSGFNMSSANSADFWKNTSYLTAGDITLKLNYEQTNGSLSTESEPENIGWKRKANGDIVTVVACKSSDAVRLFQCSGNAGQADVDNLNSGRFSKLRSYNSPISRNTQYTQSLNPFATMLVGIGSGSTGGATGDNYNDFYLTQRLQTAIINHHNQAEFKFHSKTDAVGDWGSPSVGLSYEILFGSDRGDLGKYPIQITKDNVLIGEANNSVKDYATTVVKSTNNASSFYGYGGQVSYLGGDYATPGSSIYITGFNIGTKTRTRWNLFQIDRFRSATDNSQSLGEAAVRWSEVFALNGTINTSDEREKEFYDVTNAEKLAALEIKANIRKFKWLDAIEKKGDNARIHCGVGAQTVMSILESHGLDPFSYSFLCYDEWDAILDEDGSVTVKSGNRYGIRYEELTMFILTAI